MTTDTQTVYVLTHADIRVCEDSKAHENFEDKLTAPSVFTTKEAAMKAAEEEFLEVWADHDEIEKADEGRPSPRLDWQASNSPSGLPTWDAHSDEFDMGWRITAVPLHKDT